MVVIGAAKVAVDGSLADPDFASERLLKADGGEWLLMAGTEHRESLATWLPTWKVAISRGVAQLGQNGGISSRIPNCVNTAHLCCSAGISNLSRRHRLPQKVGVTDRVVIRIERCEALRRLVFWQPARKALSGSVEVAGSVSG